MNLGLESEGDFLTILGGSGGATVFVYVKLILLRHSLADSLRISLTTQKKKNVRNTLAP
jgi:hypothetical protein